MTLGAARRFAPNKRIVVTLAEVWRFGHCGVFECQKSPRGGAVPTRTQ
jgi:hypothetical protein